MGTYHNDYNKEEDSMLWELHEIRHTLQREHEKLTVKEMNERARKSKESAEKRQKENIGI